MRFCRGAAKSSGARTCVCLQCGCVWVDLFDKRGALFFGSGDGGGDFRPGERRGRRRLPRFLYCLGLHFSLHAGLI